MTRPGIGRPFDMAREANSGVWSGNDAQEPAGIHPPGCIVVKAVVAGGCQIANRSPTMPPIALRASHNLIGAPLAIRMAQHQQITP